MKNEEKNKELDELEKQIDLSRSVQIIYIIFVLIVLLFIILILPIFKARKELKENINKDIQKVDEQKQRFENDIKEKEKVLNNMNKKDNEKNNK